MMTHEHEPEVAMSAPEAMQQPQMRRETHDVTAGVILLVFGALMLIGNVTQWAFVGELILPVLGLFFVLASVMARRPALMVPGGILTGLGCGVLVSQMLFVGTPGETQGGIVVFGLALGFLMITPLCYAVAHAAPWWPAIPGGILFVVGLALLIGGQALVALDVLGLLWPVVLIVIGAMLLLRRTIPERDRRLHEWRAPR
jgi:hypothetical protein